MKHSRGALLLVGVEAAVSPLGRLNPDPLEEAAALTLGGDFRVVDEGEVDDSPLLRAHRVERPRALAPAHLRGDLLRQAAELLLPNLVEVLTVHSAGGRSVGEAPDDPGHQVLDGEEQGSVILQESILVAAPELDLQPVLATIASHFGFLARLVKARGKGVGQYDSLWILLSRNGAFFEVPAIAKSSLPLESDGSAIRFWTDDYANLLQIIK